VLLRCFAALARTVSVVGESICVSVRLSVLCYLDVFRLLVVLFVASVGLAIHSHSYTTCWGVSWCYCGGLLLSRTLFLLVVSRFVSLSGCGVLCYLVVFRLLVVLFVASVGLVTHSHSYTTCWGVNWCYCGGLLLSRALFLLLVSRFVSCVLCYLDVFRLLVVLFVASVGLFILDVRHFLLAAGSVIRRHLDTEERCMEGKRNTAYC
jgi:hypothetical protein